jgi:hypothetical protein
VVVVGQAWWTAVPAALCLATGLVCLVMAGARIGDRASQLTHGLMGVGMAGMLSPWGDPLPAEAGAAAFTVLGAWYATQALRGRMPPATGPHLAISSVAMVLMYLVHRPAAIAATYFHDVHGAPVDGGLRALAGLPLTLLLAGYFAWHTVRCVERSRLRDGGKVPVGTRAEPVAHGMTSALMAVMFLTAL